MNYYQVTKAPENPVFKLGHIVGLKRNEDVINEYGYKFESLRLYLKVEDK